MGTRPGTRSWFWAKIVSSASCPRASSAQYPSVPRLTRFLAALPEARRSPSVAGRSGGTAGGRGRLGAPVLDRVIPSDTTASPAATCGLLEHIEGLAHFDQPESCCQRHPHGNQSRSDSRASHAGTAGRGRPGRRSAVPATGCHLSTSSLAGLTRTLRWLGPRITMGCTRCARLAQPVAKCGEVMAEQPTTSLAEGAAPARDVLVATKFHVPRAGFVPRP